MNRVEMSCPCGTKVFRHRSITRPRCDSCKEERHRWHARNDRKLRKRNIGDCDVQVAFEREQAAKRDARLLRAIRTNPDMTNEEFAERFGVSLTYISDFRGEHGLRRDEDMTMEEFCRLVAKRCVPAFIPTRRRTG